MPFFAVSHRTGLQLYQQYRHRTTASSDAFHSPALIESETCTTNSTQSMKRSSVLCSIWPACVCHAEFSLRSVMSMLVFCGAQGIWGRKSPARDSHVCSTGHSAVQMGQQPHSAEVQCSEGKCGWLRIHSVPGCERPCCVSRADVHFSCCQSSRELAVYMFRLANVLMYGADSSVGRTHCEGLYLLLLIIPIKFTV